MKTLEITRHGGPRALDLLQCIDGWLDAYNQVVDRTLQGFSFALAMDFQRMKRRNGRNGKGGVSGKDNVLPWQPGQNSSFLHSLTWLARS